MTPQDNSITEAQTKLCKRCGIIRPIFAFRARPSTKDGRDYICKSCQKEQARKRAEENPGRTNEIQKRHYEKNKDALRKEHYEWRENYLYEIARGTPEIFKTCLSCKRSLPLTAFRQNIFADKGFHWRCKECLNSVQRDYYYTTQRSKAIALYHETKQETWAYRNMNSWSIRAKAKGVPFSLTLNDLLDINTGKLPVYCRIFPHITLDYCAGPDQRLYASLDRIVPELGYVSGNVWIISKSANTWKSNGSNPQERRRIVQIMLGRTKRNPVVDTGQGSLFAL